MILTGDFLFPLLLIYVSASEAKVPARGKALINTDLSIAVPPGTYARIGNSACSICVCSRIHALAYGRVCTDVPFGR